MNPKFKIGDEITLENFENLGIFKIVEIKEIKESGLNAGNAAEGYTYFLNVDEREKIIKKALYGSAEYNKVRLPWFSYEMKPITPMDLLNENR